MGAVMKSLMVVVFVAALGGCGDDAKTNGLPTQVNPAPVGQPWKTLGEWGLFSDLALQVANPRVIPFEPISPLFTDYASKHRFIWLPEGKTIAYQNEAEWVFPEGAILVKTFGLLHDERAPSLGERIIETRLLVKEDGVFKPYTYLYRPDASEADYIVAGAVVPVEWIDIHGDVRTNNYGVPNLNECTSCHDVFPDTVQLGPRTRQLNWVLDYGDGHVMNQVDHLHMLGMFDVAPGPAPERESMVDPFGEASLSDRARSYLDVNCAHCHSEWGAQAQKGVFWDWPKTDPATGNPIEWGVCKLPTSAGGSTCGRTYDIVPGNADASVLMCRLESTDPVDQMPPLGRALVHDEGAEVLRAWIDAMTYPPCE